MPKSSQIDKAIAKIDAEIAVLQEVRAHLENVQVKRPTRKPRVVKAAAEERTA